MTSDEIAAKVDDGLPEYIKRCDMCGGKGSYDQTYTSGCGGGYYTVKGPCNYCEQTGLMNKIDGRPPSESVRHQIDNTTDFYKDRQP